MGLLLDAAYLTAGLLASPWLAFKLAVDPRYRHRLGERFGALPRSGGAAPLWIHAASVGEVALVKPLVRRVRAAHPGLPLTITTLTRSGREHAEQAFPDDVVAYYPLDLGVSAGRALDRVRPRAVVLAELEVWPNFTAACARRGIPVAVVNGRMTERSARRYRRFGPIFRPAFRRLAASGVQSEEAAGRFRSLGASPVVVTGNMKFDAGIDADPAQEGARWRRLLGLGEAPVLVGGSTHDPEERILLDVLRRLRNSVPGLRLVLAPRHLERVGEVQKAVEAAGLTCYKRSEIGPAGAPEGVIVLDTVGELSRLYAAATAVMVGGTFCPRGGQNMLEPAALGRPVVVGPSLSNFEDVARVLVEAGGMRVVDNPVDLSRALEELLKDPGLAARAGAKGAEAVSRGRGALDATLRLIETHLLKGT
jgi:3-deoxy-D-manno-octulosonic-acid transferase